MEEPRARAGFDVVEKRSPVAGLADDAEQLRLAQELRQQVVLNVARDAGLGAAVAVDDESSQSSRSIIWNATRLPLGDSRGASTRSGPLRTTVGAAPGSAVSIVISAVSSAARPMKTMAVPSGENDGALPVSVVTLPSGIDITPKVAGVGAGRRHDRRLGPLRLVAHHARRGLFPARGS